MRKRKPIIRTLFVAATQTALCAAASAQSALPAKALPRPPAVHVVTLPKEPGDKPQEVAVAVNPRDPRNVVLSYHRAIDEGSDHHPDVRVHLYLASSWDGGRKWTVVDTTHKDYRRSLDATVTCDLHGHAFVVHMGMDDMTPMTRAGEFLRRSLDGGRTWDPHVTLAEQPGNTEPLLNHMPNIVADNHAASPHAGTVYVVWDRQTFSRGDKIALLKSEIVLVKSTDDGKTWSAPKARLEVPTGVAHTTAVGHDGAVYIMISQYEGAEINIVLAVSRDGGETFETPRPVVRVKGSSVKDFPRAGGWPVMAMDPRGAGRVFVVWGDERNGDRDIFAVSSGDGGRTWTAPVRVNDDPKSNGRDQIMQWLAVDPVDGSVYVVFYDRRGDANNKLATVTLARSSDGGRSFVNYAWSITASDPRKATLGDYLGLAAYDGRVYGSWVENAPPSGKAPGKAPRKALPGEMQLDDALWPSGPTALLLGSADFHGSGGARQKGTK